MDQTLRSLRESWGVLSPVRRGLFTATAVGLAAVLVLLYSWSSSTSYVTLYSGLDPADSGRIIEQLRAQGVPFELSGGGATVSVPQANVDELRLDFAAQGLPTGGSVGFELFDGNSFTATDFVQRLNFQRGLEGELARTIQSFPAVERARVHIVLPERSLFVRDQRPTTASVVLAMVPGRALSTREIDGVAHLVSHAVEGLSKEHLTIIDQSGSLLFDGSQSQAAEGLGLASSQLEMQREYEKALERDAQQLLDRALGPAKAIVAVQATLNFDRLESEQETYQTEAEGGVPRSRSEVQESYQTTGAGITGAIPGAVANVPGANADLPGGEAQGAAAGGGGTSTEYTRNEVTSNFEVGRTVTRTIQAPGTVQRMSVSLLLDESVTPAQAASLQQVIAAAVGVTADRGDTIVVDRVPFDRSLVDEASAAFDAQAASDQILTYARLALPVVALLLAFFFFRMLLGSVDKRAYRAVDVTSGGYALPAGAAGTQGNELGSVANLAMQQSNLRQLTLPQGEMKSDLELQVAKLAEAHPDTVQEVVQSWLRQDQA